MTISVNIPEFETERLILRVPRMQDGDLFAAFLKSERAGFVGGPIDDYRAATRAFGHMVGLWIMRGFSAHVWTLKDGTVIGHGGPWYPATWPEPEFGWVLYDKAFEGKGYVTEAMVRLKHWAWNDLGFKTCVAFIDPGNDASEAVAKRLGGALDMDTANPFDADPLNVWRFFPEDRP